LENIIQGLYQFLELALDINLTENAKNIIRQETMNAWMTNNLTFVQIVNYQVFMVLPQLASLNATGLNAWRAANIPQFVMSLRNSYLDPMSRVLVELFDAKQQKPVEQPRYQAFNQSPVASPTSQGNATTFAQPTIVGVWAGQQPVFAGRWKENYRFNKDMTFEQTSTGITVNNKPFMSILKGNYEVLESQIIMRTTTDSFTPEDAPMGSGLVTRPYEEELVFALSFQNNNQVLVLQGLNTNAIPHSIVLYKEQ
jgi:hypothetical protein